MAERIRVQCNDSFARKDFVDMYNRFVRQKDFLARALSTRRIARLERVSDVFIGYADGKPLAPELVLRDEDEQRTDSIIAVSSRFDKDANFPVDRPRYPLP